MGSLSSLHHVALLCSPGMGHLIPVLELGYRLASDFDLQVTVFLISTDASTVKSQLDREYSEYKNLLSIVLLPQVDLSSVNIDRSIAIVARIFLTVQHSLQFLRSAISAMENRPTALIVDMFGTEAFAVADEFRMLKYVFFTTNAWFLGIVSYIPSLNRSDEDGHIELHKPLKIVPGCEPVRFEDTISAFSNRNDRVVYDCYKKMAIKTVGAHGVLVNTWESLEGKTLRAITGSKVVDRVYPIGPLVRPMIQPWPRTEILEWLDRQPRKSVLYVSFGSGGTLSGHQLAELAWGLEGSRQRFVWVVRPPVGNSASGSFFGLGNRNTDGEILEWLPQGFMERTRGTGQLVPTWAPQSEILAHPSVGGFLTHCGWNSVLESIMNGVPMIAWPLYAEQKMNATMLAEQLGVAVKARKPGSSSGDVIGRDEIEDVVRRVMEKDWDEAKRLRSRAHDLKCLAEEAVPEAESMMAQLVRECKCGLGRLEESRLDAVLN